MKSVNFIKKGIYLIIVVITVTFFSGCATIISITNPFHALVKRIVQGDGMVNNYFQSQRTFLLKMKIIIDKKRTIELKHWFHNYVHTFKFTDQAIQRNIDLKEEHTMRVCREILNIGEQLGLNDDELRLAEIIALFHDIGRFEQISRYQTFMDSKSVDHAELGIKILEHFEILKPFDDPIKELVCCSVKYHSKPELPVVENETCIFFAKLIRDADKLDILNVVTDTITEKRMGKMGRSYSTCLTPREFQKQFTEV